MKRVFSGIQPTGLLHLGNYLGAIRQFVKLQEEAECFYSIVDLHAITLPQEPKILGKNILDTAASYLALGLDPQKCTIFVQSQVPAHTELAWILSTLTPLSWLYEMHQYKEKVKKKKQAFNAGLLSYPILMAADILLYDTDIVPIGEDQKQHLELTRDLARRFNRRFGEIFKVPKGLISEFGARIMSLQNPREKMSKSGSCSGYIGLFEKPEVIEEKIKRAVTDSGKKIKYAPDQKPAISNLLTIYHLLTEKKIPDIEKEFADQGYEAFKKALSKAVIEKLKPFQTKKRRLNQNLDYVAKVLEKSRKKATQVAEEKMSQVKKALGLLD